jgi:hypothetical protein
VFLVSCLIRLVLSFLSEYSVPLAAVDLAAIFPVAALLAFTGTSAATNLTTRWKLGTDEFPRTLSAGTAFLIHLILSVGATLSFFRSNCPLKCVSRAVVDFGL